MNEQDFYEDSNPTHWRLAIRVVAMPADTNLYGDIFGGWLMSQFLAPVLVGDLVDLYARLERVGTTSMTVGVRAWARREQDPASREQVAQALITYVAVGEDGRPRPVESSE